jgi:hypothetical protein
MKSRKGQLNFNNIAITEFENDKDLIVMKLIPDNAIAFITKFNKKNINRMHVFAVYENSENIPEHTFSMIGDNVVELRLNKKSSKEVIKHRDKNMITVNYKIASIYKFDKQKMKVTTHKELIEQIEKNERE